MKRAVAAILIAALCAALGGCAPREAGTTFFAMDTVVELRAYGKNAEGAIAGAVGVIIEMDRLLSVTNPESEVFYYNSGGELWSKDTDTLLPVAENLTEMTDGAFDVRIYPVVEAWGFFSGDYRVPGASELEALLKNRSKLDFGGIAKGYAADIVAEAMRNHGAKSALLILGGNIYAVGSKPDGKPWSIAVQDPFDLSRHAGVLKLRDTSAVTSGAYQRYFEMDGEIYHHIIDPRTGYPANSGLASVTVVSANSTLADGLSTGFFVLGKERALEVWRENPGLFELILIEDDGMITITAGLEEQFESENSFEIAG